MTAMLNRAARCAATALAIIAVGAAATACDPSSDSSPSKVSVHGGPALEPSSGSPSDSKDGGSEDGSKDDAKGSNPEESVSPSEDGGKDTDQKGPGGGAENGAPDAGGQSARCHTTDLDYHWDAAGPDMETDSQQTAMMHLTNKSAHTCTLQGFPGVSLLSDSGQTWDLVRSSDTPSTITLHSGEGTAAVSLSLLPLPSKMEGPTPFRVADVLLTLPNETTHQTLKWPYGGEFLDQSGATHPGTFVNPIGIG